ncbi:MAG: 2-amino-4-hydroxy-6-hydroxymethyldihydropteridine diphosphokinase [Rhizobiaceae bacterium]|nr:2-amino-4-hydroxy-6-hydroxymethyldihydropteridine diphosphokinase [Rhizobiaceae bacterium]
MSIKSEPDCGEQKRWQRAWLGLGGNVGDVLANMRQVLEFLTDSGEVKIIRCSDVFETPPWGLEEQPVFLNCCVEISTPLEPEALLELCLVSEKLLKRKRGIKWGPRTIDVDVLLLEGGPFNSSKLKVPHPRILERAFVLVPLAQIAPNLELEGKSIARWRALCDDAGIKPVAASEIFDEIITSSTPHC